jgi:hypothetical protein
MHFKKFYLNLQNQFLSVHKVIYKLHTPSYTFQHFQTLAKLRPHPVHSSESTIITPVFSSVDKACRRQVSSQGAFSQNRQVTGI